MILENNVTIGHKTVLHGCTVGEGCLIGINGKNCLTGTNAHITEGKVIPDYSLVIGSPGEVLCTLGEKEIAAIQANAAYYVNKIERYLAGLTALPAR